MSIKSLAYNLQQALPQVKRTHWYELVAAGYGFKSFAALNTPEVLFLPQRKAPLLNIDLLRTRAQQLGLNQDVITGILTGVLTTNPVAPVNLNQLADQLEKNPDDYPGEALEELDTSAHNGNGLAAYCLSLIAEHDAKSPPPSDYWYMQELKGEVLSESEFKFAESYRAYLFTFQIFLSNARIACRAGVERAQVRYMRYSPDAGQMFATLSSELETLRSPALNEMAEVCRSNKLDGDHLMSLVHFASEGEAESLKLLADCFAQSKPIFTAALIEFAQLLGVDLTQSYAKAIDEEGNDFEDDTGGNVYALEHEGIERPTLTEQEQEVSLAMAASWFSQFGTVGKADLKLF